MMEQTVELWDLYDSERRPLGRTAQRGVDKLQKGEYHIVVHICIFNSKNELLIQRRQPWKKGYSHMWDVTVGGSALAGETSAMAAQRELQEEIGYHLDFSARRPAFTFHFPKGFDDFYMIEQEIHLSTLVLQQEEVEQVRWATKEEVLAMQKQGEFIPYWMIEHLFDRRCWYGSNIET